MHMLVKSENSLEAGWAVRPTAMSGNASFELVQTFGDRIYSIAKHITQSDDAAEDVLIETFQEVCPELDGWRGDEDVWLRLVAVSVAAALSKLRNSGEGRRPLERVTDPYEDLVVRELSVWGDNYEQRYSRERTTCILEHGLRTLDPMCRTVFVLRDIEDISVEHTAKIVNRSIAAVEVCLLRARLQLRETLTRQMRQQ